MSYEIVDSQLKYKGHVFEVYKDVITMPDNKTAVREIIKRGNACAIVPIDKDGKIVFVRQYRHPVNDMMLEIPAGVMEKGEEPLECASRELEEEIGYKCKNLEHLLDIYGAVGICDEKIYIYLAEELEEGKQNFDEDEFIEVERYTPEEAVDMIYSGLITDSKTVAGVMAYLNKKSNK